MGATWAETWRTRRSRYFRSRKFLRHKGQQGSPMEMSLTLVRLRNRRPLLQAPHTPVGADWEVLCCMFFVTPWTVAHQAPLSMEFSRQEYWRGCHSFLQGIFLTQGLNPRPVSPALQADSSPTEPLVGRLLLFVRGKGLRGGERRVACGWLEMACGCSASSFGVETEEIDLG